MISRGSGCSICAGPACRRTGGDIGARAARAERRSGCAGSAPVHRQSVPRSTPALGLVAVARRAVMKPPTSRWRSGRRHKGELATSWIVTAQAQLQVDGAIDGDEPLFRRFAAVSTPAGNGRPGRRQSNVIAAPRCGDGLTDQLMGQGDPAGRRRPCSVCRCGRHPAIPVRRRSRRRCTGLDKLLAQGDTRSGDPPRRRGGGVGQTASTRSALARLGPALTSKHRQGPRRRRRWPAMDVLAGRPPWLAEDADSTDALLEAGTGSLTTTAAVVAHDRIRVEARPGSVRSSGADSDVRLYRGGGIAWPRWSGSPGRRTPQRSAALVRCDGIVSGTCRVSSGGS